MPEDLEGRERTERSKMMLVPPIDMNASVASLGSAFDASHRAFEDVAYLACPEVSER